MEQEVSRKSRRIAVLTLALVCALLESRNSAQSAGQQIDLKVLVITADGREAGLPAIRQVLDYHGTPYALYVASATPGGLTAGKLSAGSQGFYQGILLATGDLGYNKNGVWTSALTAAEWDTLRTYERTFAVRRLAWYTFPHAEYGFDVQSGVSAVDTTPPGELLANFTASGRTVFSYMNTANAVPIRHAYTYLATAASGTDPLITDAAGHALGLVNSLTDGRQTLALTFDSNPHVLHNLALGYGLVNWVTKGLFLGERRTYLGAQVDDLFLSNDVWVAGQPCTAPIDDTAVTYRMTGDDLRAVLAWQSARQADPVLAAFRLDLAMNGFGTTDTYNEENGTDPDTLTPVARQNQARFKWINHTYDHANLDAVTYNQAFREIDRNNNVASNLGLSRYNRKNLVTPDVSGLTNLSFLNAAWDAGVRYLVSDTSRAGYSNPSPNAGIYNALKPGILMIPRRPNNLFFNVSLPAEWVAEYNCFYGANGRFPPPAGWGYDLNYGEILDRESDVLLSYLLKGDLDPLMFHQPNLRAFDCPGAYCPSGHTPGRATLLGDLLDTTFVKYKQLSTLPILSPTMNEVGVKMADRMKYNVAGVRASVSNGAITVTAAKAAVVPVTGLNRTGAQSYGGQYTSYVTLAAGQSVTLPLQ
jgi:hypothetical protein